MTDVVSLRGGPLPTSPAPDDAVVKTLEAWLERARSGQITEIALAGVYRDGDAAGARAGPITAALLGSITLLLYQLTDELSEISEEV